MWTSVSPPTDNLYKFIALFGIALVVLGFYVYHSESDRVTQGAAELNESIRALSAELGDYPEAQKVLIAAVRAMEQNRSPDHLLTELRQQEGVSEQAHVLALAVQQNGGRYLGNLRRAKAKANQAMIGLFAGMAVACLGFWLWYDKLQRYQDTLVKKQAEAGPQAS